MSVLSPEEFTRLFGEAEQNQSEWVEDKLNAATNSLLKTLISPVRAVGEIAGIDGLIGAGEAMEGGIDRMAPVDPTRSGFGQDLASGAGSLAAFLLPGGLFGLGAKVGTGVAAGLGMSSQGLSGLDDARQHGATPDQERTALLSNTALGSIEALPVGRVFGRAAHEIADEASGGLMKIIQESLKGAAEEGAQEGVTALGSNVIAKDVAGYDPERDRTDDVAYSALLGAILGGPVSGAASMVGRERGMPIAPQGLDGEVLPPMGLPPGLPKPAPQQAQPTIIDGEIVQPQAAPQETAANAANSLRNLDLTKPLEGEVEVQIDNGDGQMIAGYWHEATDSVREAGQKPSDAVLAAQPAPEPEPATAEEALAPSPDNAQTMPRPDQDMVQTMPRPVADNVATDPASSASPLLLSPVQSENSDTRPETAKPIADQGLVDAIVPPTAQQALPAADNVAQPGTPKFRPYTPDEATQAGAQAFASGGQRRMPADMDPRDKSATDAWYQAWDRANLAEPVPGVSTLANPDGDPSIAPKQPEAGPENAPTQARQPIAGRPIERATAETMRGTKVDVEYAIVDAGDLVASNTDDGGVNPDYPREMQPRDRDRKASSAQISDIASDLKPEWLDKSPKAADGAPIVAPDGVVESGNGRTLAVRRAYAQGKAGGYRDYLAGKGYPVDGVKAPMLVRIRKTDLDPNARQKFAAEANERDNLSMSATEQAMADARALPDGALDMWRGGDVDAVQNRDFVRAFIQSAVGKNEQAEIIAGDGSISQAAIRRIQGALLAKAYSDADLVGAMVESTENDIRAIGGALLDVSAVWAKMRVAAKEQRINPDADSTRHLIEAVRLVQRARREGTKISLLVGQQDIFSGTTIDPVAEAYLKLMFRDVANWTRPVGREKLGEVLAYHVDQAMKTTPGIDLLGQAPVSPSEALAMARAKLEKLYDAPRSETPNLFAAGNATAGKNDGETSQVGTGQGSVRAQDGGSNSAERPGAGQRSEPEVAQDDKRIASEINDILTPANKEGSGLYVGDPDAEQDAGDAFDAALDEVRKPEDDAGDAFDAAVASEFGSTPAPTSLDDVADGIMNILKEDAPGFKEDDQAFDDPVYEKLRPFLRAGISLSPGETNSERMRALVGFLKSKGMTVEQIAKLKPHAVRFANDLKSGKESLDVSGGAGNLEPDSGNAAAGNRMGSANVPASTGRNDGGSGPRGSQNSQEGGQQGTGGGLSQDTAANDRGGSDLTIPDPEPEPDLFVAPDRKPIGGRDAGKQGPIADPIPAKTVVGTSAKSRDVNERREAQKAAEKIKVEPGIENIRATLPMLHPEQQDDIAKIEDRFAVADGILVTSGTGTGKTFVGLGAVKRFARQGKENTLIVAPSDGILKAWIRSAHEFGLSISMLDDTKSAGKGIVATTYANLGKNDALARRDFDLVVTDEAHMLSSNAQGNATDALRRMRALTGHPDGFETRARSVFAKEYQATESAPDDQKERLYKLYRDKADTAIAEWKKKPRAKALMLSATPFAHHFSLDYAEGYLFDFPKDNNEGGYNRAKGRNLFYVENLGYRMRYNKLTKPDAEVRTDLLERALHEKMKKSGAVIGRTLEVENDYDRKFVLTENELGRQIDDVFKWLSSEGDGRYWALYDRYQKKFDYLSRARLLEAMKARSAIPLVRKNIEMGRKVMVFHNFNTGGGFNPFENLSESKDEVTLSVNGKPEKVKVADLYNEFVAANPHVPTLNFASYLSPIKALKKDFENQIAIYNGTVSKKARDEGLAKWNKKGSGVDLIVVQSDAGQAGLSGHDTTGDAPRILYNLGLPTKPTAAIQQEGRIYRDGQKSDAMFRYLNTGTTWERMAFASTIAQRASTAENLAMGDHARALKQGFIDAYLDSADWEPGHAGEGTGGKETDRAMTQQMTPFQRAKTYYYAQQKRTSRDKSREGVDYFATPEPIGVKMVEWANIKDGESILEPSAGHGAIARWFPEGVNTTIVEPSQDLLSKAMINTGGGARAVHNRFENFNIVNKFNAIVMNPPFGVGGKTAIEHLDKAAKHLKNGGRIVALLPTGPAADKRFDAWYEGIADIALVRDVKMPSVTFKRAGTGVMTRIVVLEKQIDKGVEAPAASNRDYSNVETIEELFDRIEDSEVPARAIPETVENDIPDEGVHMVNGIKFELFPMKAGQMDGDQIAKPASFLGREAFTHLKAMAERHEGNYQGGSGRASGFRFVSIEDRNAFLNEYKAKPSPDPVAETDEEAAQPTAFDTATAFNKVRGKNQYVATLKGKVGRERYLAILAVAKEKGGYYSSFKGPGAVPGFQFNTPEDRQKFLDHFNEVGSTFEESSDQARDRKRKEAAFDTSGRLAFVRGELSVKEGERPGNAARNYVIEKGKARDTEHLVAIDADGRIIEDVEGVHNRVDFTKKMDDLVSDPSQAIIVHHNHPNDSSFSPSDINMLFRPGLAGIYAHGHDGGAHFASIRPEIRTALSKKRPVEAFKAMQTLTGMARRASWNTLKKEIDEGRITVAEGNKWISYLIGKILHDGGVIEYDAPIPAEMLENKSVQKVLATAEGKFRQHIKEALNVERTNVQGDDRSAATLREHPGTMGGPLEGGRGDAGQRGQQAVSVEGSAPYDLREEEGALSAPIFYSEVLRAADRISQAKAQPAQWLAMIRKAPGVKPEEIEWLGLEEWLGSQTGTVTKDQVVDFIRANQIEVQEVEKGVSEDDIEALLADEVGEDMRNAALDGLALFEDGPAFDEPASQNWTVPKRGSFDILVNGNGSLMKRLRHAKSKEAVGASIDNWRVRFQDRFLPMLRVEQAIEAHKGEQLPEEMKVYLAEELYTGRVGSRLDRIQRRYMEPIAWIMRENGLEQDEVGEYLYARHAGERNARIAEINPKMPDGGSGMKTEDAKKKLAEFEAREDADAFKMIGKMLDRMLRESVRFRVEAGLLSQQSADKWARYQHYVPLRGFEEIDEGDEPGMANTGKGFTAKGPESRMAMGRRSRAGDILATAYSVAHEAIIRGEKNRVVQRLYDLAKAHPNKDYWEINPVKMARVFNRATGMVTERPESPIFAKDADRTVSVKFNGIEQRIVLHDPDIADAVRRLNAEDLNGMLKFLIGFNRYLSTMNTTYNPEFVISNAIRDIQTASVVMAGKDIDGLSRAVMKDYRVALQGSWGGLRGKPLSTEWRKWFNEYDRAGGKIAFYKMETINELRDQVDRAARQMSAKDYRRAWRGVKAVGQFVEDMNLAVDNALRLSLYKNLRERGFTQDQAASAAKNLTVNFNRRGQYGVIINGLYLFANAGIQGSAVVINSLKHRRAQQMVGAMVAGSFALTMANILLLSGEDDNEESDYSKLVAEKEWELQRNLVVMVPGSGNGQSYVKFPLPYGYNVFHTIGRKMAEVAMGLEDGAGAIKDAAVTFVDSFNPIGGTDSLPKLISPTVSDPFVEIVENRDFAGRKIRPERDKYDDNIPKSQDYYGSVSPYSRHLAKMLNEWTGGNEFKPGAMDLSPEWIDHGAKFLGGAASSTLWRPVNTTTKLVHGEEITTNDIPFLRRVHGKTGHYVDRSLFYSRVDEIQAANAQTEGFRKKGDREGFNALDDKTKALGAMNTKGFRAMMRKMRDIRNARNEIYAMPLSASERAVRLKQLEEAEMRLVQGFNKAYLRTVARARE